MDYARRIALNSWSDDNSDGVRERDLLMEPHCWATLDYTSITDHNVGKSNMVGKAMRDGTAHGLLIWFDAEIADGLGFSNGPQEARIAEVYGRGFFPLLEPVAVEEGDAVTLAIEASYTDGDYDWHWSTFIQAQNDATQIKADFKQSTALGLRLEKQGVLDGIADIQPLLGEYGKVDRFVLGQMDGRCTIVEIAERTFTRFPASFKNLDEALLYIYELSQQVD